MKHTILILLAALTSASYSYGQNTFGLTQNYWSSKGFLDRLMGSYGFSGEIEPSISEEEAALFRDQIVPMMQAGQVDSAIQTLATALTPESSAQLDFNLGNLFFQRENFPRALQYYNQAVGKFENFLRVYRNMGFVHVRSEQFDEAVVSLLKVIELGEGDGDTYGLLAFCYMNREQYGAAESAYRNAILLDPNSVDWRNGLIQCLVQAGRSDEAIILLEDAILADPKEAAYWQLQTDAFVSTRQYDRAIGNLEMLKRLGLSDAVTMKLLGELYMRERLPESALGAFKLALEAESKLSTEDYVRIAQTFLVQGNYDETESFVEQMESTVDLSSTEKIEILNLKSKLYLNTGRTDEAAKILQQLIDRDPNNGEALILLAEYNADKEQFEKAGFLYERATKVDDYAAEAYLDYAQMRVTQKQYAKAVPLLRSYLRLKPSNRVERYLESVERAAAQAAANENI
ncbi:MAG: tetratricopeptide repeat protein [Opitutales bacterium]